MRGTTTLDATRKLLHKDFGKASQNHSAWARADYDDGSVKIKVCIECPYSEL